MKIPSTSLVQVLIVKSILEAILVVSLAGFAFINLRPPYFQGEAKITNNEISGWVVNSKAPGERVEVQLFVDGKFIASAVANQSQRGSVVMPAGATDEAHGYTFPLELLNSGVHEARIFALHGGRDGSRKTLRLVGVPVSFTIEPNGKAVPASGN
jgi:hypothetical protein